MSGLNPENEQHVVDLRTREGVSVATNKFASSPIIECREGKNVSVLEAGQELTKGKIEKLLSISGLDLSAVTVSEFPVNIKLATSRLNITESKINKAGLEMAKRFQEKLGVIRLKLESDPNFKKQVVQGIQENTQTAINSLKDDPHSKLLIPPEIEEMINEIVHLITTEGSLEQISMFHILNTEYKETADHSVGTAIRTAVLCQKIIEIDPDYAAQEYGLGNDDNGESIKNATKAALFHDLGKILVPPQILYKVKDPTAEEFQIINLHSEMGEKIIQSFASEPKLKELLAKTAKEHHLDPGQCSEALSKIIKITDVHDALLQNRSYRPRFSPIETLFIHIENYCNDKYDSYAFEIFYQYLLSTTPEFLDQNRSFKLPKQKIEELKKKGEKYYIKDGDRLIEVPLTFEYKSDQAICAFVQEPRSQMSGKCILFRREHIRNKDHTIKEDKRDLIRDKDGRTVVLELDFSNELTGERSELVLYAENQQKHLNKKDPFAKVV